MSRHLVTTKKRYRLELLVLAAATATASFGCNGGSPTGQDPAPPRTGFAAQIQPIFDANCVRCHAPGIYGFGQTGGDAQNGLDLTPASAYRSLVNQQTFQLPSERPAFRVRPGAPEESYVLQKLGTDTPKDGQRMPLFGPYLSEAEIQLIRDWIARGAPND